MTHGHGRKRRAPHALGEQRTPSARFGWPPHAELVESVHVWMEDSEPTQLTAPKA